MAASLAGAAKHATPQRLTGPIVLTALSLLAALSTLASTLLLSFASTTGVWPLLAATLATLLTTLLAALIWTALTTLVWSAALWAALSGLVLFLSALFGAPGFGFMLETSLLPSLIGILGLLTALLPLSPLALARLVLVGIIWHL